MSTKDTRDEISSALFEIVTTVESVPLKVLAPGQAPDARAVALSKIGEIARNLRRELREAPFSDPIQWKPVAREPLAPGAQAPVAETMPDLLCDGLRHAGRVSGLLNEIAALGFNDEEIATDPRLQQMHALLLRRFSDYSGLSLFIAADKLRLQLPADLRGDPLGEEL